MADPLPLGGTIGILGGGQLGRMLAVAASRLGLSAHVFDPDPAAPAGDVARALTTASYHDEAALAVFAASVDVITYEFENIPAAALELLQTSRPVRPGLRALSVSQDRLVEKTFLSDLGLEVAPFAPVSDETELAGALETVGAPSILKTRRLGYDGKGQVRLRSVDDGVRALATLGGQPAILEGFVDFDREISVIAARGRDGQVRCFDPGENVHEDGILRTTRVPAGIADQTAEQAMIIAEAVLSALDYVGVIGVEMFVRGGGLIVNEFAPRVHNSGHWTQNGCAVDQFEQHIRAIAGWSLGDPTRHADVGMENLIGADIDRVPDLASSFGAAIHLYGKTEVRPGRKMGHVNFVRPLGT